jgi:hypothetical protein
VCVKRAASPSSACLAEVEKPNQSLPGDGIALRRSALSAEQEPRERKRPHHTKRHPLFPQSPSVSPSNLAELNPELDSLRIVDVEHGDRGSADGGSPDKNESHPFEVAPPALPGGTI